MSVTFFIYAKPSGTFYTLLAGQKKTWFHKVRVSLQVRAAPVPLASDSQISPGKNLANLVEGAGPGLSPSTHSHEFTQVAQPCSYS